MTTLQDQPQVPNGACHHTNTGEDLRVSSMDDLKLLIESKPTVRAFIEKVLADFAQAHGQREESIETAHAKVDKKEEVEDTTPAVPTVCTTNGKGKPVAATPTAEDAKNEEGVEDTTPAVPTFRTTNGKGKPMAVTPTAEDASTGSKNVKNCKAAAATTEVVDVATPAAVNVPKVSRILGLRKFDAVRVVATNASTGPTTMAPSALTSAGNVPQQRVASAVIVQAPLPAFPRPPAARASTAVRTGLRRPHITVSKAEHHDLLRYIGPASVHEWDVAGANLPSRIPHEITLFIDDVRNCVGSLGTFDSLYYVEYHGGTWFFAAGLLAYLHRNRHRTNYVWNYDDYVVVRKDIQRKLLAEMKAGRLRGIQVGDDMLAPGNDAGKGGNNGWPYTWFVRPDVYWERFADAAGFSV